MTLPTQPRRRRRRSTSPALHGYRPGDRMLVACEGGPVGSQLVRYPPPLEIEEGHRAVYVLDEQGTDEAPEYVYVFVPERM